MSKYEAMFIVGPDLSENERKQLFDQINQAIVKFDGEIINSGLWSEKRKFYFPIKKFKEGIYYLVNFSLANVAALKDIKRAYALNEGVLRVLVLKP